MPKFKVLDCTLRDGGYINRWNFGYNSIKKIYNNLLKSKVDYIEIGFLKNIKYDKNYTLYSDFEQFDLFLKKDVSKISVMIMSGEFDIAKIPRKTEKIPVACIRYVFKKEQAQKAFVEIKDIVNLGYTVSINPANIDTYTEIELIELIKKVNELKPDIFCIVDTKGVLREKDLIKYYNIIEENLEKNITLGFHSHNNLQLSFSNAQSLIKICKRELIIDSSVFGMGRGAGNLPSELLVQYLNENYKTKYNIVPILKIIDEQINPIFAKTPWGYSVPYYLAAINGCHPNYAKYLTEKQTVPVEIINNLLNSIPNNKKTLYDEKLIRQIYLDNFSNVVDDKETVKLIKKELSGKEILVIAPGKSIALEKDKIKKFIKDKDPYIISSNFNAEEYEPNLVFITNQKRYDEVLNRNCRFVVTSNIKNATDCLLLNYSSYLNHSKAFDNNVLMLLKLLAEIGIKKVNFAGFDGFSTTQSENYANYEMINNAKIEEFDKRNEIMSEELKSFKKLIDINFITKTQYSI